MSSLRASAAAISCILFATPGLAQQRSPQPQPPAANPNRLVEPRALPDGQVDRMPIAEQDNMALGVGLFSVTGHFVRDRGARGREPLIDTGGKQNRVAAVGWSLRF
ncbi:MAG TPA: hypothetical protein VIT45_01930 [Allosphingosinicella sp.]